MDVFPREILFDILSRVPTSSLLIIKLVCRSWRGLAEDPSFVTLHFNRMTEKDPCLVLHSDLPVQNQLSALYFYTQNEKLGFVRKFEVPPMPEFQVVGSCNGLLCVLDAQHKNTFFIYNPFTGDCTEQPKPNQNSDGWSVFGFGFHQRTEEFKVVKIDWVRSNRDIRRCVPVPKRATVEILTLGSSSWRSLADISYHPTDSRPQVLVNGRLHWASWPERYRPGRKILSLDMEDELFREVLKPDSPDLLRRGYNLLVLKGCLSAAFYGNYAHFNIWVMKEYGVRESWSNEFSIGSYVPRGLEERSDDRSFKESKFYRRRSFTRVLCGLRNGEILLEYKCRVLVCYNPTSAAFRDLEIEGMPNWFEAITPTNNV